ncbi:hypothetical protein ABE142_05920 [Paenibacillus alvei]|uniref:Cas10/Cmr2 second palm domain-containing protein n=1 Tax=Paenibacillus alvei TaxID=44250 RepID=UPI003D2893FA
MAAYVYIDVSQKQEFIFNRNELKENLYHSFAIKTVTEDIKDKSEEIASPSIISLTKFVEKYHANQYKFVYSGGGNSIIRFSTEEHAKQFVQTYSAEVYRAYPSMELYMSIVDESELQEQGRAQEEKEKEIRQKLRDKANKWKDKRMMKFKRWSYGVEEIDATGLPVLHNGGLHREYQLAKKFLYGRLETKTGIPVTEELKDYKKDDDGKSYIGVIALDGNKMGDMVRRISSFEELGNFSELIEEIYELAVVRALNEFKLVNKDITYTPIVLSGDDICLIVHAEHAIQIAAAIVNNIRTLSREDHYGSRLRPVLDNGQAELSACAGVAIAKYNYPFFELVKTAELLCKQAKEAIYRVKGDSSGASFIHWDTVQGQVLASYAYEDYVKHGRDIERFHMKPLRIDQQQPVADGVFSYEAFVNAVADIQLAQANAKLSSSLLEGVKKVVYSGLESYRLFIDMKKTDANRNLVEIMQKHFPCDNSAIMSEQQGQTVSSTYLLNDVIDALPYINMNREAAIHVRES